MAATAAPLRIILMGQSAFAEKCLQAVVDLGAVVQVLAVYTNCTPEGKPAEPVKTLADSLGIPVYQHKSLKATDDALKEWQQLRPQLVLCCYVTQFVPDSMLTVPEIGAVCFHPSILPKYRGGSALQWQLINGEEKGGLSWFWMAPAVGSKVDDGALCLTAEVDISPEDTSASLYFNKIFPLGIKTCVEAVQLVLKGDPPRTVQNEDDATWQPLCNDKIAKIDWSKSAREVHNFIRGCDPQPGAYAFSKGGEGEDVRLRFYSSRIVEDILGEKGVVVEVGDRGVVVACGSGGGVAIGKIKGDATAKMGAKEFADANKIEIGTVFI